MRTGRVAVVTDSTACLPPEQAARAGIRVVPLRVQLGERESADFELDAGEVLRLLRRHATVTTSAPSPRALRTAYAAAHADGAAAVVSLHLAAEWSGTRDAAMAAAAAVPLPVTVLDLRTLGAPLGWAALDAAAVAAQGADVDTVASTAHATAGASALWFLVPALDHLRRSGRLGGAAARIGTALAVKPVLRVREGALEPVDRVRTLARALDRLVECAGREALEVGATRVAVHHLGEPERAREVAARMSALVAAGCVVDLREIGAGIGAHVGPGVLGIAVG